MKTTTISFRACWVAAATLVVVLGSASPSMAAPAGHSRPTTLRQDPDLRQQPNPLGFQGLASPEQDAEEGTLSQGPGQVDAEVGAGEHDVVDVASSAPQHNARGDWVVQGVVILLFLAVVTISMRVIFKPSDQIPRIGGSRSHA